MLYKIIPASPVASIIDAESPESAIVDFACVMDLDMNTYFKAVPATEEDVKEANTHDTKVKEALFISVWDGGVEIDTPCKVNLETKEVFDIVTSRYNGDHLEKEYIEIDGEEFPVSQISDIVDEDNEFWYD